MKFVKKLMVLSVLSFNVIVGSFTSMADTSYNVNPSNIQYVIDHCNDSANNRVILNMAPGTYNSIKCYSPVRERYISLIGENVDTVLVASHSGIYDDPAAMLRINGEVKNITFTAYQSTGKVNLNDKGAYAIHADYGSQHTVFENCKLISYQSAALGMGMTPQSQVTLRNCTLKNLSNPEKYDTPYWRLGALYAHSAIDGTNNKNSNLRLVGCVTEAPEGAYGKITVQDLHGLHIDYVNV